MWDGPGIPFIYGHPRLSLPSVGARLTLQDGGPYTLPARQVAKKILEEIFQRFRVPKVIGSDNGPAFVSKVSQGLAETLGTNWKLHCAYHPQSSGQVERMNRTLKETLTKLSLETGTDWVVLLPLTLF